MDKQVKRTERGWAGHFICATRCEFRRNTLLEYGNKKWIISTVGRLVSVNPKTMKEEFTKIGLNRYYETMAFEAAYPDEFGYVDADVSKPIEFDSKWAIGDIEADSETRANDMHEAVVLELMGKIKLEGNNG
jgi:hypothetical protein